MTTGWANWARNGGVALALGVAACGSPDASEPSGDSGNTASITLELSAAPADAVCHRVSFTGPQTFQRSFDVAVGATAPVSLTSLPTGKFTVTVTAFGQSCATVPATASPTFAAEPVTIELEPGTVSGVTISLRRAPSTNVVLDYDTAVTVYTAPDTVSIRGLATQGNSLFVADSSQIVRIPEMGGGATTVATAGGILAVGADANNVVWSTTMTQLWRVPSSGFAVPRVLINTGANMLTLNNGTVVALDSGAVRVVPVSLATPSSPTTVLFTGMTMLTADTTNAYFSTFGSVFKQVLTAASNLPPTTLVSGVDNVLNLASDGTTLFYVTADALRRVPVAGGAMTTMTTYFQTPIALVLADSANVYFLTTALTTSPTTCIGATLNRIAKTGTVATPIWSRAGMCPNRIAQTATGVFLADTNSSWVLRVPK